MTTVLTFWILGGNGAKIQVDIISDIVSMLFWLVNLLS